MKCTKCGTPESVVLSTRSWLEGSMLQRRRECFNGHRFTTYEVGERLAKTLKKYAEPSAKAIENVARYWRRDQRITKAVLSGRLIKDIAADVNLSESNVSRIVKRHAPDYNARSNGGRIRAKQRKEDQCNSK